jgi:8-oxo-dGTP pyrophosphatase MutT (NUDIX family)
MNEHARDGGTEPRQAAAIPVRLTGTEGVRVCLIRRKSSSKWGIPKGYIDPGYSWAQAALEEADEEAGLLGHVIGASIGTYNYNKGDVSLTVAVFLMEVLEERTSWREMRWRERRWCSVEEASELLKNHRVWPMLDRIAPSLASMSNSPRTSG